MGSESVASGMDGRQEVTTFPQLARDRLALVWNLIFNPSRASSRIVETGSLLLPLCLVWIFRIVFQLGVQAPVERIFVQQGGQRMTAEQLATALAYFHSSQQIGLVVAPLFLLLKWMIVAFLMYLVLVLIDEFLPFRSLLALVGFSSVLAAVADLQILLILRLRGFETLNELSDLQPPIGAGLLFGDRNGIWYQVAEHFNVFELWGTAFLALAVHAVIRRRSITRAVCPSFGVWLFVVFVQTTLASLVTGR